MAIVTLSQAKAFLRLPVLGSPDPQDVVLEPMIEQAEAIVLEYISRPSDEAWTTEIEGWDASSVPKPVLAAMLRQCADLWRFRGDDDDAQERQVDGNDLSPRVKQLLKRYRDPVVA